MKVHLTNLYGQSPLSVALMAQNMVANISKELGFKEIGVYSFNADGESVENLAIRFDGMNAAISNGDVVIFQSPTWNGTHFDYEYISRLKIYNNLKIVIFIHDVVPLMFKYNYFLMEKTIAMYNLADLIIVPSEKMLKILRKEGLQVEKIIIQNIWDHKIDINLDKPKFSKIINFAGEQDRFNFINEWQKQTPLYLYSTKDIVDKTLNVKNIGWKFSVELLSSLNKNGGFGLVWNQTVDGEYYDSNVSYKLSTYLAAGIPVIVPSTLSNAWLVKQYNLGIVIDSLDEIDQIVQNISNESYFEMLEDVWNFRKLLVNGYFSKKILINAVNEVILG